MNERIGQRILEIQQAAAQSAEISLAGVLRELDTAIEIARTKGPHHLSAISDRARVAAAVTDILIARGDADVIYKLSRNYGASFSNAGFTTLAGYAESDERLAESLGLRPDMPPQLLKDLVLKATEAVRKRLLGIAAPEHQAAVQDVLASVSDKMVRAATAPRDFRRARALVEKMHGDYQLDSCRSRGPARS